MTPNNTHVPNELRLAPIDPPGLTISIPATVVPWDDGDRYRCRVSAEGHRAREILYELGRINARGTVYIVSFGDRLLGQCVVERLAAGDRIAPDEYRFELVLHRKKLPPAFPEKDRSDGQAEERALAPARASLSMLTRAIAHFHELARRLLADRYAERARRARGAPSRIHRSAIGSTEQDQEWPRQMSQSRSSPTKIMSLPSESDLRSYRAGVSMDPGQGCQVVTLDELVARLSPGDRALAEEHLKRLSPNPMIALPVSPNAPTQEEILREKIAAMRAFFFKDRSAGATRDPE